MKRSEDARPKRRVLVTYPFSTPASELVGWIKKRVVKAGFEVLALPIHIATVHEFRSVVHATEGLVALCVPFDEDDSKHTSAWMHNWVGALATQPGEVPIMVIASKGLDMGGLAVLREYLCPIRYPAGATSKERRNTLERIGEYLTRFLNQVRASSKSRITQVHVVLVDIVAFTSHVLREDQVALADRAKMLLKRVVQEFQERLLYQAEGGDGGYFVFDGSVACVRVLEFAERIVKLIETAGAEHAAHGLRVRVAIDTGAVGHGISCVDWRRTTLIGPPMNVCARIIGNADDNQIIATERFYRVLVGESYKGRFGDCETTTAKRGEQYETRRYVAP